MKIIKNIYNNENNKPIIENEKENENKPSFSQKFNKNDINIKYKNELKKYEDEDDKEDEYEDKNKDGYEREKKVLKEKNDNFMENRININNENVNDKFLKIKFSHDKMYDTKIEKDLIYLPFLDTIKKVLSSIILLIELFKVKKTDLYIKIENIYRQINKDNKLITLKEIKEKIDFLKNLRDIDINIISFNENDYITLLIDFLTIACNNEEGIKFAFGKTNEEIRALSEFVGETENSKIQIRDVQDFMDVCNFFENIKALNVKYDIELIEKFKNIFIAMPSFGTSFKNFLNNFKEIKAVYEEYLDKPEDSRKKIEQILKFSNINISFDDNSRFRPR